MSLLPNLTPKETGLKKKRIDLLTNKVQPNFAKEFKKLSIGVESVVTDQKTLDSYFVVRLPANGKPNDTLLMEIKNKIFSSGRFIMTTVTTYSFKVSISLSNVEEGFKFSPLKIDSNESLPEISTPPVSPPVEVKNEIPISNLQIQTTMPNKSDLREKVKELVQSCDLKGGKHYTNIILSEDGKKVTVNLKEKKFAEKLFDKRLEFGEEGLVSMKPGSKSVRFFKTLPSVKPERSKTPSSKKDDKKVAQKNEGGFKSVPEAISYLSKHLSEMNSGSAEKMWKNIGEKHGTGFELLVRVRSKETEQVTLISKKDFLSFDE